MSLLIALLKSLILCMVAVFVVVLAVVRLDNEEDVNDPWKPKRM